MSTVGIQIGRFRSLIKSIYSNGFPGIGGIKAYSVFPPSYIRPTFRKDEQALLEQTAELEALAHTPIKPALITETSSEFYDPVVDKFTNYILRKGKKKLARSLLSEALENLKRMQLVRYHKARPEQQCNIILNPVEILHKAVVNTTPVMELTKMKRGGASYMVPVPINENRQRFLAMNWIIRAAQNKDGKIPFSTQLARELLDASNNHGRVVKQKQDLHKQCEANRAYAHYRWS